MKKNKTLALIFVLMLGFLVGCKNYSNISLFTFHFIDVGQGHSTLIEFESKLYLIDAGNHHNKFQNYLNAFFINHPKYHNTINYFIVTHADADHILSASWLYDNYIILYTYMPLIASSQIYQDLDGYTPTKTHNTIIYDDLWKRVIINQWEYITSDDISDFKKIKIFQNNDEWIDINDFSPLIFFDCGKKYVCITGDATSKKEDWWIKNNIGMFPCYLYLIAHHGSATSSSLDFLKRIIPDYAILSCSDIDGTKFGHPNITTLKTIKQFTSNIFSTQDNGDLIFIIKNNQIIVSNQWKMVIGGWSKKNGIFMYF